MVIITNNSPLGSELPGTGQHQHHVFDHNEIAETVVRQYFQRGVRIYDDDSHLLSDGFCFVYRIATPSAYSDALEVFVRDHRISLSLCMPLQNVYRYHKHQVRRLKDLVRNRFQISRCCVSLSLNRAMLISSLPRHEDSMLLSFTNQALDDRDQFIATETHIRHEMGEELFL